MEKESTAKKILFVLLDVLLVAGALASILTIDHGRWITSNPAFYAAPPGATCLSTAQMTNPYWSDFYLLNNTYDRTANEQGAPEGSTGSLICPK